MYKVYKHTFPNGKIYIGITSQRPERRWKNGTHYDERCQPLMFRAIQKYGWDNIKHEILFDNLTKEEAEFKEIELIAKYKSNQRQHGYNIQSGGHCSSMSEETKKKISKSNKGRTAPMKGKHHSEETKKKLSQLSKGRKLSEETKLKLHEAQKGKKPSQATILAIKKANTGRKPPNTKKVICVETGEVFESVREASKSYHCDVCKNLKRLSKTAGGYHWRYMT